MRAKEEGGVMARGGVREQEDEKESEAERGGEEEERRTLRVLLHVECLVMSSSHSFSIQF